MYGENQKFETYYNSSANDYGAAPDTNPAVGNQGKGKKKKGKSHPFLKKGASALACGVAFGLAASTVFVGVVKATGVDDTLEAVADTDTQLLDQADAGDTNQESDSKIPTVGVSQTSGAESVAEIAKASMPFTVSITNKSVEEVISMFGTREYEATSAGSGIIIGQNEEELLIATNNHVVSGSTELSVCFDDDEDKVVSAKIKGTDPDNDLAIVAVSMEDLSDEIKSSIKIAKLGNSDELEVGDQVIAIGNALGYGQSVTTGIISAKDREVTIEGVTAELIQTDAAINPGNSGGALLNMNGELIGINSSKFASTTVEGMGYAIPISTAQPILEELMSRQTRDVVDADEQGFLGISCQNVSSDISEMYNIPQGVYVLGTEEGSSADKAGLHKGDIITRFDNKAISRVEDLKSTLQYYKAGEQVELTVERAGSNGGYEEMTITVTLGENTDSDNSAQEQQNEQPSAEQEYESPYDFFGGLFNYGN